MIETRNHTPQARNVPFRPWPGVVCSSPRHQWNMIQPERLCIWTWRRLHEITRLDWRKEPNA